MSEHTPLEQILEESEIGTSSDELETGDLLDEFGRMERAHGIALAFQAASEGDTPTDRTPGLLARLRAAWTALRGETPVLEGGEGDTTLEDLAELASTSGDAFDQRADQLREELEERSTTVDFVYDGYHDEFRYLD